MGNYCKAYLLSDLRRYPLWTERAENARRISTDDGASSAVRPLSDNDVVYIQESFVVTDDIFLDTHVLFDAVDAGWIEFCEQQLGFALPADVIEATRGQSESTAA